MNELFYQLKSELESKGVILVTISKTKPPSEILKVYNAGQRIFGENKVQELTEKQKLLPDDIQWHLVGHLQTNKVKYIASFVQLIHSVDSFRLLVEINNQAKKHNRIIKVLLQIYIAREETKFGLTFEEAKSLLEDNRLEVLQNILICGMMGMATLTADELQVHREFSSLRIFFKEMKSLKRKNYNPEILSMGMSGDYQIAIAEGSNMVRIGSAIFGERI